MSENCLIFTTHHRERVAEVRVRVSGNSKKTTKIQGVVKDIVRVTGFFSSV